MSGHHNYWKYDVDDCDDKNYDDDAVGDDDEDDMVYGDHKYWAGPSSHESITRCLSPLSWTTMMIRASVWDFPKLVPHFFSLEHLPMLSLGCLPIPQLHTDADGFALERKLRPCPIMHSCHIRSSYLTPPPTSTSPIYPPQGKREAYFIMSRFMGTRSPNET